MMIPGTFDAVVCTITATATEEGRGLFEFCEAEHALMQSVICEMVVVASTHVVAHRVYGRCNSAPTPTIVVVR